MNVFCGIEYNKNETGSLLQALSESYGTWTILILAFGWSSDRGFALQQIAICRVGWNIIKETTVKEMKKQLLFLGA